MKKIVNQIIGLCLALLFLFPPAIFGISIDPSVGGDPKIIEASNKFLAKFPDFQFQQAPKYLTDLNQEDLSKLKFSVGGAKIFSNSKIEELTVNITLHVSDWPHPKITKDYVPADSSEKIQNIAGLPVLITTRSFPKPIANYRYQFVTFDCQDYHFYNTLAVKYDPADWSNVEKQTETVFSPLLEKLVENGLCSSSIPQAKKTEPTKAEEWNVKISPQEIEMTADGVSQQKFTVTVLQNNRPKKGEKIGLIINDDQNKLSLKTLGSLSATTQTTNEKGEAVFVYKTSEQEPDFIGATIGLQAIHQHGNPKAVIKLIPGFNFSCGNWNCEQGETIVNCPEDCPKDISYEEAEKTLRQLYREKIALNPYFAEGTAVYDLFHAGVVNNLSKSLMDSYVWVFKKIEQGGGWVAKQTGVNTKVQLWLLKDIFSQSSEKFEAYTCGAYQTKIIALFDSLRLSPNATERKIMDYFDYAPMSTNIPFHEGTLLYKKGTDYQKTGLILDPWVMNNHNAYPYKLWTMWGVAASPGCTNNPNFPVCGKDYLTPKNNNYEISTYEQDYYDNLSPELKNRVEKSLASTQQMINIHQQQTRNIEKLKHYQDLYNLQKKYLLGAMRQADSINKVKIIVDCPVQIILTDQLTGAKTGIDEQGKPLYANTDVYFENRVIGDNNYLTFIQLPDNKTQYQLTLIGQENGSARIIKSVIKDNITFETQTFRNLPILKNQKTTADLDNAGKTLKIRQNGQELEPEIASLPITYQNLDNLLSFYENLNRQNLPADNLLYRGNFDLWSILFLIGAVFFLGLGIFFLIKKKIKTGILLIVLSLLLGIIIIYRYFQIVPVGSDLRQNGVTVTQAYTNPTASFLSPAPTETDYDMTGRVMSPNGTFSIYAGEKMFERVFAEVEQNPQTTNSFIFCYKLADPEYESGSCSKGKFPLYSINVYTRAQFEQAKKSPLFEASDSEGYRTEGGYYYTITHPNGEIPDEITANIPEPNWEEYYITVLDSLTLH